MKDEEILELLKFRNEKVCEYVSEKYGNYCYVIAYRILQNEEDAEECVNDTLMILWNSSQTEVPDNLKLYLAKITRNLALNRYKSSKRSKRGGGEIAIALEEIGDIVSDSDNAENEFIRKEFSEAINKFLHSISDRDCGIFIDRYFQLESIRSIAQKYGISENNVLKILSRTRKKLKIFLEKEGYTT